MNEEISKMRPKPPSTEYQSTVPIYGPHTRNLFLPFYRQIALPVGTEDVPVNPSVVLESCGFQIVTGGVMGYVLGIGLGLFMGVMGDTSPIQVLNGREVPQAPLREQVRSGFKSTLTKSGGWGKSFAVLTALFGGVECIVEKYRGKHDGWNSVLSGCIVGGTMGASGGPAGACLGCAGFAGFGFVVDKIMGHH